MTLVIREWSIEEGINDFNGESGSDNASAHREDIGIVVKPRCLCGKAVMAQCAAYSPDFIGGDGYSDAGAADQNAEFAFAGYHSVCYKLGKNRIVAGCSGIRAEIPEFNLFIL